jgi:hypothetical protein
MPAVVVAVDDLGDHVAEIRRNFLMPFEMRGGQAKFHASADRAKNFEKCRIENLAFQFMRRGYNGPEIGVGWGLTTDGFFANRACPPIPKRRHQENKDKRLERWSLAIEAKDCGCRKRITKTSKSWGPQRLMIGFRLSGRLRN